jgi:tRNA splicing endonuclease
MKFNEAIEKYVIEKKMKKDRNMWDRMGRIITPDQFLEIISHFYQTDLNMNNITDRGVEPKTVVEYTKKFNKNKSKDVIEDFVSLLTIYI